MDKNIYTINELSKGLDAGMNAINIIITKTCNENLELELLEEYFQYLAIKDKLIKISNKYMENKPCNLNYFAKFMAFSSINISLINKNDSKLAELMINGTTMGIIKGRKLLNSDNIDKRLYKLLKVFIKMQEKSLEKLKTYL